MHQEGIEGIDGRLRVLREVDDGIWKMIEDLTRLKSQWDVREDGSQREARTFPWEETNGEEERNGQGGGGRGMEEGVSVQHRAGRED